MKLAIFDFNRTLYDPDAGALVPGAKNLLDTLQDSNVLLVLLSMKGDGKEDLVRELGIGEPFAEKLFISEKTAELFQDVIIRHGVLPRNTYVIGDHLHKEIRLGNEVGARTIQFKVGKFAALEPEGPYDTPWRAVTDLSDVGQLIA